MKNKQHNTEKQTFIFDNSVVLVHDKQMGFIVQYTELSVLTWRKVHVVDMNSMSV